MKKNFRNIDKKYIDFDIIIKDFIFNSTSRHFLSYREMKSFLRNKNKKIF